MTSVRPRPYLNILSKGVAQKESIQLWLCEILNGVNCGERRFDERTARCVFPLHGLWHLHLCLRRFSRNLVLPIQLNTVLKRQKCHLVNSKFSVITPLIICSEVDVSCVLFLIQLAHIDQKHTPWHNNFKFLSPSSKETNYIP